MNQREILFILLCAHSGNICALETPDPLVTIDFDALPLSEVKKELFIQTRFNIASHRDLEGEYFVTLKAKAVPVSSVFDVLRKDYRLCAYRGTSSAPITMIKIRECGTVERDCSAGVSEPYPRPHNVTLADGTTLYPNIGPWLCGGPEYVGRLNDGSTHRSK